jgi:hypothetical protein
MERVTSDTFQAMMENNALHHVCMGIVYQLDGAPLHFSHHAHTFLSREFPEHWIGRG